MLHLTDDEQEGRRQEEEEEGGSLTGGMCPVVPRNQKSFGFERRLCLGTFWFRVSSRPR